MSFKDSEISKQRSLIEEGFYGKKEKGGGTYKGKNYSHILKNAKLNLYTSIRKSAIRYFHGNKIAWWGGGTEPTGNTKSSQVACLNHLFALRDDEKAVEKIVKGIDDRFTGVLPIPSAYDEREKEKGKTKLTYIAFEVVSTKDHLGEGKSTRGANCTSIDALIYAKQGDEKWLIVIEWKYTESYSKGDKSRGDSGETRMRRYNDLINCSKLLVHLSKDDCKHPENIKDYQGSVYYQEPFYQLMRQTLWAEQVIKHRKNGGLPPKESFEAEQYLHLHVIPKGNYSLLRKKNKKRGEDMETTWTNMLTEEGKRRYKTIDPEELLAPIVNDKELSKKYSSLIAYLKKRYWDRP